MSSRRGQRRNQSLTVGENTSRQKLYYQPVFGGLRAFAVLSSKHQSDECLKATSGENGQDGGTLCDKWGKFTRAK
jgi:hypothetical protein